MYMEYIIELILDVKKINNITEVKDFLHDLAKRYNCSIEYFNHEIDGHKRIIDNNCYIYYINFDEENFNNLINLIKTIKITDLTKNVVIDCIYEDGESSNIIYGR